MILRDGTGSSFLVEFSTGVPDNSAVTWELRSSAGIITNGTVSVPLDAVSVFINIAANFNTLPLAVLSDYRDLSWSYTVGGRIVNGEARYTLEARLPYGVSTAGVRRKLGIDDPIDLPDGEISVVSAYLSFENTVGADNLASISGKDIVLRDAIEAAAALQLIPTMSVRIAKKEDSGTSSFQRQDVDWATVGAYLEDLVTAGIVAVVPSYDETLGFGALFILAGPATDPFTGA